MTPARASQAAKLALAIMDLERLMTLLKRAEVKAVRRRLRAALHAAEAAWRAKDRP